MDLSTNSVRKAVSSGVGTYSFVGLPIGTYRLTISKTGFRTEIRSSVTVQAEQTTDVNVTLKVGTGTQQVTVSAAAVPLLQTTNDTIATTISVKQLTDLPLSGRNVSAMSTLVPGYAHGTNGGNSTWNGLPVIAQSTSIDGVIASSSRMKFSGAGTPGPSARLDSISEMTVSTSQLGVNQGFGQGAMTSSVTTIRGTNAYHGHVYEDFRNTYLNANSWTNNAIGAPRNHFILNDFGGSVGGPILKNKLFFFGAFGMSKQPGGYTHTGTVLTKTAQQGIFTETNGSQVNLFSQVAQPNSLPDKVNSSIASQLSKINGVLSDGKLSPVTGDPNLQTLSWFVASPATRYYPTVRVDYNLSRNLRVDVAWNETKYSQPGISAPYFPGSLSNTEASNRSKDYTSSLGIDWTISPTLVNQFRGGYYYNATWYAYDATSAYTSPSNPIVNWAYGESGQNYNLPITTYYPIINFSDGMTWQKGSHMVTYGVSYWREQDHYWNPPDGILTYSLGLAQGDPALTAFDNYFSSASSTDRGRAEALYATLIGRVTHVGPNGSGFPLNLKTGKYSTPNVGEYPLDELTGAWGLYINDSWHVKPTLTVNYGLRWDLVHANHDLTSAYHSANMANAYGPTAPGDIFKPGTLNGVKVPMITAREYAYQNYYKTPQPRIGFAWNPRHASGLLGKLTGDGQTVIRASFNLRRFTEPQQYYWDAATNYGYAYYQSCDLSNVNPSNFSGVAGTFPAGGLSLGLSPTQLASQYPFICNPPTYQKSYTQASQDWTGYWGGVVNGFNFNIRQPYLEEWTLNFQRQIGNNNVLQVTYLGHHALHEWVNQNPNEVNVFENGFLTQFKAAQTNMAINAANGHPGNFAYMGYAGQKPLPIFEAVFSQEESSPYTAGDYTNGTFVNWLNQGNVGAMAGTFSYNPFYYCSLVGSAAFPACSTNVGFNFSGNGYPINFWMANPYATGGAGLMVDSGFGNYNALQIDFRQHNWHGMQFDANYTWSHSLGIEPNGNWTGGSQFFTLRNMRLSYGPAAFDIRQVVHVSGTYDLPFGNGQRFLRTGNAFLNRVVSGWTLGTIVTYQTGLPNEIMGGYNTFNDFADGGSVFKGLTVSQIQSAVGVYHIPGATVASGVNPNLFSEAGGVITGPGGTVSPNTTPGMLGQHAWIYGPHFSNTDIAITKRTPIRENLSFTFQAEFLNAFNHPNWTMYNAGVQSPSFGNVGVSNTTSAGFGREVQFRASIDF